MKNWIKAMGITLITYVVPIVVLLVILELIDLCFGENILSIVVICLVGIFVICSVVQSHSSITKRMEYNVSFKQIADAASRYAKMMPADASAVQLAKATRNFAEAYPGAQLTLKS